MPTTSRHDQLMQGDDRSSNRQYSSQYSSQYNGEGDSGEWVWSNPPSASVKSKPKSAAASTSETSRRVETGGDLLIDLGESNKPKKSTAAPKVKTAEEEAWDMLNG